jgi:hypothetical protein
MLNLGFFDSDSLGRNNSSWFILLIIIELELKELAHHSVFILCVHLTTICGKLQSMMYIQCDIYNNNLVVYNWRIFDKFIYTYDS